MDRRFIAVAAVALLVVLAVVAIAFLASKPPARTESSTTQVILGTGMKSQAGSLSGLQLGLSINATNIRSGQSLLVDVYEVNPTSSLVNLSAASAWLTRNLGIGISPCTFENEPISFDVLRGAYGPTNVTGGIPLQLDNYSVLYHCPPSWTARYWAYEPNSNTTVLNGCQTIHCSSSGLIFDNGQTITIDGTFTTGSPVLFQTFTPGVYTIVAGDEWGAAILLQFTVRS